MDWSQNQSQPAYAFGLNLIKIEEKIRNVIEEEWNYKKMGAEILTKMQMKAKERK